MEEYLKEMDKYEHYKFSYPLEDIEILLTQEDFLTNFVTMINNEMKSDYINESEQFSVYIFINKKDSIYQKPLKFVFNDFYSKIFGNSNVLGKSKYSDTIQSFFDDIKNNNKIDKSKFKIDFFVFSKEKKKKSEKFNNIFTLIRKDSDLIEEKSNEMHFRTPIKSFLIDTTNFVSKYWLFIFGSLTLLVYFYNRYKLLSLGFPSEIISNIEVLSVLKLYTVVFMPYIIGAGLLFLVYIYGISQYTNNKDFYTFLKGLNAVLIYFILITFAYHFYLIKFKKGDIEKDDLFLIEYLYEGYYPRFAKDKNDDMLLILGEATKKTYLYKIKDFGDIEKKSHICKLLEANKTNSFEKSIISLLKNSDYPHTKNIIRTNNISGFKVFNKDNSLKKLKEIYCSKKKSTHQ